MKNVYVYPASFCPPTYGHLYTAAEAASVFPKLYLVCSKNPDKSNVMFSPDECKRLWQYYDLPKNVEVLTLEEFMDKKEADWEITMVRGVRNEDDAEYEKKVMLYNRKEFGVKKFFYVMSDEAHKNISSSKVRAAAKELKNLSSFVSPLVGAAILEKTFSLKNVFLVVGPPGSGKTTLLKELCRKNDSFVHVNTDEINHELRPFLSEVFPGKDLVDLALNHEDELLRAIKNPWLSKLKERMKKAPPKSTVFIEAAYGLCENKKLFDHVGGRVIFVGCGKKRSLKRNEARGTKELAPFTHLIPSFEKSRELCKKYGLSLLEVDSLASLKRMVETTEKKLKEDYHD